MIIAVFIMAIANVCMLMSVHYAHKALKTKKEAQNAWGPLMYTKGVYRLYGVQEI